MIRYWLDRLYNALVGFADRVSGCPCCYQFKREYLRRFRGRVGNWVCPLCDTAISLEGKGERKAAA